MRFLSRFGSSGEAALDHERKWPWPNRDELKKAWVDQLDDTKADHKRRLIMGRRASRPVVPGPGQA